jgi:hypothetical protein
MASSSALKKGTNKNSASAAIYKGVAETKVEFFPPYIRGGKIFEKRGGSKICEL